MTTSKITVVENYPKKVSFCNFFSKEHTIRKVIFFPKIQFWQIPTFSRVFYPKFTRRFISSNQNCPQLKSSKPQHFHEFLPQKIFSKNQSWIFEQKMMISNIVKKMTFKRHFKYFFSIEIRIVPLKSRKMT